LKGKKVRFASPSRAVAEATREPMRLLKIPLTAIELNSLNYSLTHRLSGGFRIDTFCIS
jgi:hypothetical protein